MSHETAIRERCWQCGHTAMKNNFLLSGHDSRIDYSVWAKQGGEAGVVLRFDQPR